MTAQATPTPNSTVLVTQSRNQQLEPSRIDSTVARLEAVIGDTIAITSRSALAPACTFTFVPGLDPNQLASATAVLKSQGFDVVPQPKG